MSLHTFLAFSKPHLTVRPCQPENLGNLSRAKFQSGDLPPAITHNFFGSWCWHRLRYIHYSVDVSRPFSSFFLDDRDFAPSACAIRFPISSLPPSLPPSLRWDSCTNPFLIASRIYNMFQPDLIPLSSCDCHPPFG